MLYELQLSLMKTFAFQFLIIFVWNMTLPWQLFFVRCCDFFKAYFQLAVYTSIQSSCRMLSGDPEIFQIQHLLYIIFYRPTPRLSHPLDCLQTTSSPPPLYLRCSAVLPWQQSVHTMSICSNCFIWLALSSANSYCVNNHIFLVRCLHEKITFTRFETSNLYRFFHWPPGLNIRHCACVSGHLQHTLTVLSR